MSGKTQSKEAAPVQLHVGSPVWRFDENRRHYAKPDKGREYGELIWREHWEPLAVIGETSRSWVIGHTKSTFEVAKIAKADCRDGACPRGWAFSKAHIDENEWIHMHRHRLIEFLRWSGNYAMLREVARISGYDDKRNL